MNIYILDKNIKRCAEYHCDQHVHKMLIDNVQMLCTALNNRGYPTPFQSVHPRHECVKWVEESYDNFVWLEGLTMALNNEYKFRFRTNKDHQVIAALNQIRSFKYESLGLTDFVQSMPWEYRVPDDPVAAYRSFYTGEKLQFARWTRRQKPAWIEEHLYAPVGHA